MAAIKELHNVWRDHLLPASFRTVEFHVELNTRQSGRRTVVHEYPKRDLPYSEDMGRHAIRYAFTAYLIHNDKRLCNVLAQRDALRDALERVDAGWLIHPSMDPMLVMVERYSMSESKQKGGYYEFDLQFVEAGVAVLTGVDVATNDVANQRADAADAAANSRAQEVLNQIQRDRTARLR